MESRSATPVEIEKKLRKLISFVMKHSIILPIEVLPMLRTCLEARSSGVKELLEELSVVNNGTTQEVCKQLETSEHICKIAKEVVERINTETVRLKKDVEHANAKVVRLREEYTRAQERVETLNKAVRQSEKKA